MGDIRLYKAQSMPREQALPSLTIRIEEEIPKRDTLQQAGAQFADQARLLVDALITSLPGGTFDAILVEMMRRKVSLFVVPYQERNEGRLEP
jgi:hypothetical protein